MRSQDELFQVSGYANRISTFGELMRVLDGELRLITPTDPEGIRTDEPLDSHAVSPAAGTGQFYQLTHD